MPLCRVYPDLPGSRPRVRGDGFHWVFRQANPHSHQQHRERTVTTVSLPEYLTLYDPVNPLLSILVVGVSHASINVHSPLALADIDHSSPVVERRIICIPIRLLLHRRRKLASGPLPLFLGNTAASLAEHSDLVHLSQLAITALNPVRL